MHRSFHLKLFSPVPASYGGFNTGGTPMAKFVFAMNVSLDGYVDHDRFAPDTTLFCHWIDQVKASSAAIYGRKIYEIMRYWEEDKPDWGPDEQAFAQAWLAQPKWVASRTLTSVGPNATLVSDDLEKVAADVKARFTGVVDVCGTILAQSLSQAGLVDEYRLYLHPVVLGAGKPFFAGPVPPLRLSGSDMIDETVIRLTYVGA
jgi:dihydrofolate reductase